MSPVTEDMKNQIIQRLLKIKEGVYSLENSFLLKGENAEAEVWGARGQELAKVIDRLLVLAMQDWLDDAADVEARLHQANESLEERIESIKDSVDSAQQVIEALGYVDDAIGIGRKLLLAV